MGNYSQVKQQRVVELIPKFHQNFITHLKNINANESSQAYILNVGKDLIESVNEDMVRVSIPYKHSANGYGVIILPKENICLSEQFSEIQKEHLYDIDLGSSSNKLCVKYVDENGNQCNTYLSTRYIERYMNYTAYAYQKGFSYGSPFTNEVIQKYDMPIPYNSGNRRIDSRNLSSIKSYFDEYNKPDGFDYDSLKLDLVNSMNVSKAKMLDDASNFMKNYAHENVKKSNMLIFSRAYISGNLDYTIGNIMALSYAMYPPEESSLHFKIAKSFEKMDSPFYYSYRQHKQSVEVFSRRQNPTSGMPNRDIENSNSESFMRLDSMEDEWLPFG